MTSEKLADFHEIQQGDHAIECVLDATILMPLLAVKLETK
jgi:hypothetical protein